MFNIADFDTTSVNPFKKVNLPPCERAELVDKIISSFNYSAQNKVDELWAMEAEERIDAYEQGKIGSISAEKVFEEIDRLK